MNVYSEDTKTMSTGFVLVSTLLNLNRYLSAGHSLQEQQQACEFWKPDSSAKCIYTSDRLQISLLVLREFKRIN